MNLGIGISIWNKFPPKTELEYEKKEEGMLTVRTEGSDNAGFNTSRNLVSVPTSKDFTSQPSMQCVLGKFYLVAGSEVSKNDIGMTIHNCVCEIDTNERTRIQENTSSIQVMLQSEQ